MNSLRKWFVQSKINWLYFLLACLPVACTSQEVTDKLDNYLKAYLTNRYFSGAVLVAQKGKILLRKGYGMANDEQGIPVLPETKFRIASLTKSFTAMAVMQLEEAGKLSLEDKLQQYLPTYPRGGDITLFQILHHTSGIPDLLAFPAYWEKLQDTCTAAEAVEIFKNQPLNFEPGSQWEYSNSNYVLLGYIIENITGQGLPDYFEQHIFKPLGMKNTGWEGAMPIETFGATGYQLQAQSRVAMPPVNMSVNHGAGALFSTVDDLYKWDRALYTEKLVKRATLEKIFTPHLNAYGGGWGIMPHQRFGKAFIFMNGRFSGFSANISRYPDDDICIIVLSNLMDIDPRIIGDNLAAILFGEEVVKPSSRTRKEVPSEVLRQYVGTFHFEKMSPPLDVEITLDGNGKLWRSIAGRPDKELIPAEENVFFYEDNDVDIVFENVGNEQYNKMLMNLLGAPYTGYRI
ncbi:MAG: beta-lactamase family protein [Lewinellaceae bacterium]|nr:beta-lactamase family protein [Saprospiraceae bacterium]MCB9341043.1 beta-lactamase family protein [Lewinellaceae bacterium]